MNILSTQYTLATKSFEIYVAGCKGNPHCKGCHNPESWRFDQGRLLDDAYLKEMKEKIYQFDVMIKNIMFFGGEPLDQTPDDLEYTLKKLQDTKKAIWLFTRYPIEEVPEHIKSLCTYIKCGKYIPELASEDNIQYGIKLATSNQKIYQRSIDY